MAGKSTKGKRNTRHSHIDLLDLLVNTYKYIGLYLKQKLYTCLIAMCGLDYMYLLYT